MKTFICKLLILFLVLNLIPIQSFDFKLEIPTAKADVVFSAGDGTEANPFQITNCVELQSLDSLISTGKYFALANNIDCSLTNPDDQPNDYEGAWSDGKGFDPIGENGNLFEGNLDGRGNTISGLFIDRTDEENVGLFGEALNASFKNLKFQDTDVRGQFNVAVLVGNLIVDDLNAINNVFITDSLIDSSANAGFLVGIANVRSEEPVLLESLITSSSASASTINAEYNAGGLIGVALGFISISDVYFTGNIFSTNQFGYNFGGLVGSADRYEASKTINIDNAYASGEIANDPEVVGQSLANVGGIIGNLSNSNSTINNVLANVQISDTPTNKGAVVGLISGLPAANDFLSSAYYIDTAIEPPFLECIQGQLDNLLGCNLVNDIASFYNDNDIDPFFAWDFSETWSVQENGLPTLQEPQFLTLVKGFTSPVLSPFSSILIDIPFNGDLEFLGSCNDETPSFDTSYLQQERRSVPILTNGDNRLIPGTYSDCRLRLVGDEGATEYLIIPPFTVGVEELISKLDAHQSNATGDQILDFQLSFNSNVEIDPTFQVENGELVTIDKVNTFYGPSNFNISVRPNASNLPVTLTVPTEGAEDVFGLKNAAPISDTVTYLASEISLEGEGTEAIPYLINSCEDLQAMELDLAAFYKLKDDINCTETNEWNFNSLEFDELDQPIPDELDDVERNGYRGFNPIGDFDEPFTGTLDGNNKTISGLWIFRQYKSDVGLFGNIKEATVRNLNFTNSNVVGAENTGTLAGTATSSFVSNVTVDNGTTRAYRSENGGGIIGNMNIATIFDEDTGLFTELESPYLGGATYSGTVHGTGNVIGGLVGRLENGYLASSSVDAQVDGGEKIGGAVGSAYNSKIVNVTTEGTVILEANDQMNKAGRAAGGLVGELNADLTGRSQILSSSSSAIITTEGLVSEFDNNANMGGLVGLVFGNVNIKKSFATGDVNGVNNYNGGLIGSFDGPGSTNPEPALVESYATGDVTGGNAVGGLVGYMSGVYARNVYATGNVIPIDILTPEEGENIGGLIGLTDSVLIENTYATGNVVGSNRVGGLVGYTIDSLSSTIISNSFAVGSVTSSGENAGGLVGELSDSDNLSDNYFDKNLTNRENCSNYLFNIDQCTAVPNTNFYDELNGPFTIDETKIWNPDDQYQPWSFAEGRYPLLNLNPVFEVLDPIFNGTESVTLRANLVSGRIFNFEGGFFNFLEDSENTPYFNIVTVDQAGLQLIDFGGNPLLPSTTFVYYTEGSEIRADIPIDYDDGLTGLLCGTEYSYMTIGSLSPDEFTENGDVFDFYLSNNQVTFTTPSCDSEPEEPAPTPRRSSGGGGGSSKRLNQSDFNIFEGSTEYDQEVQKVLAEKIVTENPEGITNKCEALTMMSRVFEWEVPTATSTKYTDVPSWCTNVAAFGTERGIVEGRTATTLGMETPVTRDEIALMLFRELKLQKYKFEGKASVSFTDTPLTPWASEAILALSKEGIIRGFADGTFGGTRNILKQDFGVMLLRGKRSFDMYNA